MHGYRWSAVIGLLLGVFSVQARAESLTSFTFFWMGDTHNVTLQVEGQIYAWSGNLLANNPTQGATGPALFSSGPLTYTLSNLAFKPISIHTGELPLDPGNYVALLTVSVPTDYAATTGGAGLGIVGSHVSGDGGGGFNFFNNGAYNSGVSVNNGNWNANGDDFADYGDLAWFAVFSSGLIYDTTYAWNGTDSAGPFGYPDAATFGQTFVVKAEVPEPGSFLPVASALVCGRALVVARRRNKSSR